MVSSLSTDEEYIMLKQTLHPAVAKFLKAWEKELEEESSEKTGEEKPERNYLYTLRERMSEKLQVVAAGEVIKKLVRMTDRADPSSKRFGVDINSVAPNDIFSDHTIGKALTSLVREQGMKLCYSFPGSLSLRF